jgi:coenzyme F420-dependent glucose-6-phosphate dehydrogenase
MTATLAPEQKGGVADPIEIERLADENADQAHTRFICSDDPDNVVEKIAFQLDLGFDDVLYAPGNDQAGFLDQFGEDVLPKLRERARRTTSTTNVAEASLR